MTATRTSLLDEIALRRASIVDAQLEFEAGEMSGDQLAAVKVREESAIARCEDVLANSPDPTSEIAHLRPARTPRLHRRRLLYLALLCFTLATAIVLIGTLSPRQPGGSDTGSIVTTPTQHVAGLLREAEIAQATSNGALAVSLYNQVLVLDANNVEALTQSGWLSFSAGSASREVVLVRLGAQRVARAVALRPSDPDPRLYYAIIAASTPGDKSIAIAQFRIFLALKPSDTLLALAQPWLRKLKVSTN